MKKNEKNIKKALLFSVLLLGIFIVGGAEVYASSCIVERPNGSVPTGNISASAAVVNSGQAFNITIAAQDANGLTSLCVDGDCKSVSGTSASQTWQFTKNSPGAYTFCGQVSGYIFNPSWVHFWNDEDECEDECCDDKDWGDCKRECLDEFGGNTSKYATAVSTNPGCVTVSILQPAQNLNVSCSASPNPSQVNQTVSFVSSVSGGTGSYTYSWSGACTGSSSNCQKSFSQSGSYTSTVTVNSGSQTNSANCSVSIASVSPQCSCGNWSAWQNQSCGQGGCGSYQRYQTRTRNCTPYGCDTETESRCTEDSSCQSSQPTNASGSIYVSNASVCTGDLFTITITGQDSDGLVSLAIYDNNDWQRRYTSGNPGYATERWEMRKYTPGTYNFCGQVVGHRGQYWYTGQETVNTSPYCVSVNVSDCQQQNCSGSNYPTYCGYGTCADNQKPYWFYSNNSCTYNCSYDSSCQQQNCSGSNYPTYCGYGICADNQKPYWFYSNNSCTYNCGYDSSCGTVTPVCECTSGSCCDGCHYRPSSISCNYEVQTEYSCPFGNSCGGDVGKRTKTKLQYCSGYSASCNGRWSDWLNWTNWTVSDACSSNEVCVSGSSQCQYSSSCAQPSYLKHFSKACYDNDLYWLDSNALRNDKYKECSDGNDCTVDSCQGSGCVNELKCDGSTCQKESENYCQSCNHCGDGVCGCEETVCSCPADCTGGGQCTLSLLGKKDKGSIQWVNDLEASPGENINFLMVVKCNTEEEIENAVAKAELPDEITYKGNLQVDGFSKGGDIRKGIDIGTVSPQAVKIITFDGQVKSMGVAEGESNVTGTLVAENEKDDDSMRIAFHGSSQGIAAVGLAAIKFFVQKWYFWVLAMILLSIIFFFVFRSLFSATPI